MEEPNEINNHIEFYIRSNADNSDINNKICAGVIDRVIVIKEKDNIVGYIYAEKTYPTTTIPISMPINLYINFLNLENELQNIIVIENIRGYRNDINKRIDEIEEGKEYCFWANRIIDLQEEIKKLKIV